MTPENPVKVYKKARTVPIYGPPLSFIVVAAEDIVTFAKQMCPCEGDDDADKDERTFGFAALRFPNAYCFLSISPDKEVCASTLFHEIDHISHRIMRNAGMVESPESEESYTYLSGWLGWALWKCVIDWGLKVVP